MSDTLQLDEYKLKPLFKRGDTAWLKAGKGVIDVTISERFHDGKFYYRVVNKSGNLWKDGKLVPQRDLTPTDPAESYSSVPAESLQADASRAAATLKRARETTPTSPSSAIATQLASDYSPTKVARLAHLATIRSPAPLTGPVMSFSAALDGENYAAHLGLELFQCINDLPAETSERLELISSLEKLWEAFARKLELELGDSNQVYRDIMPYIRDQKMHIIKRVRSYVVRVHESAEKQKAAQGPSHNAARTWLESNQTHDDMILGSVGNDEDRNDEPDHDRNKTRPTVLPEYHRDVQDSSAYNWLRERLRREVLYPVAGIRHIARIRKVVLGNAAFLEVSRQTPHAKCNVQYVVDWDPWNFVNSQDYDEPPNEVITRALTLTGSPTKAEALTSGDYIRRTWPDSGEHFLHLLQLLLKSGKGVTHSVRIDDITTVQACIRKTDCVFEARGQPDTVVEIGEQVSWISCALRSSDVEGPVACVPELRKATEIARTETSVSLMVEITATIESAEPASFDDGYCWRSLFCHPLLVQGFPIARRPTQMPGLEMPLITMTTLMQTPRIVPFKQKIFIKGHSTMLVAVQEVDGVVMWHAIANGNGEYIHYHDERVSQHGPTLDDSLVSLEMTKVRHIVGWWSEVENLAGKSRANLNVRGTGLGPPKSGIAFERVTVGGGKYITASANIALCNRDKPARSRKEVAYNDQVRQALINHVVLYDTKEHRAWLLDGATALLHLARASLVADEKNGFRLLHKNDDIQEEKGDVKTSAIGILTNPENMRMTLYDQPDEVDTKTETKHVKDTTDPEKTEVTLTHKATHQRFSDRVSLLYSVLEEIFNHQSDMSSDGVGLKISMSPLERLEGFEFRDIANGAQTVHPKAVNLGWKGKSWVDLLRNLHAVTLFGRDFGDILEPRTSRSRESAQVPLCTEWDRVPSGHNYLAVSNITLQEILENYGDQSISPLLVSRDLYWHCPDKYCEQCTIASPGNCRCDRVQVILPKTFLNARHFQSPKEIPIHGATIFGHSQRYPLWWKASYNATETKPDEEPASTTAIQGDNISNGLALTGSEEPVPSRTPSPLPSTLRTSATPDAFKKLGSLLKIGRRNKDTPDAPLGS